MLKYYFKIVWRNLIKNKFSTSIKIGGLAAGLTVTLLIGLWIYDELSFNQCFQSHDRIGLVMRQETSEGIDRDEKNNTIPLGNELRSVYSDVFKYVVMSTQTVNHIILSGDKSFIQSGNFMQPEAPEMFNLRMLSGLRAGLNELNSILLSKSLAKKLFGAGDPINKIITIDTKLIVRVTGVYEDFPDNCDLKNVSFISPWDLFVTSDSWYKNHQNDWTDNFLYIYVQLSPRVDFERASAKIKDIKQSHLSKEEAGLNPKMFIQPMNKWHLYSQFKNGVAITSDQLRYVWVYSIIDIFVLVLACINFVNLSTLQSEKRAKEVGIRKAAGSLRSELRVQFFSETMLVVTAAFLISILLAKVALPSFNQFSGKKLVILWTNPYFWLICLIFIIITGIIAGIYPAMYLSSFNPVKVLKGTFRIGKFASIPRKILVVIQFIVSIALIIGSITVYRQIRYSRSRPVGYRRAGLIFIEMKNDDIHKHFDAFRGDLLKTNAIEEVAESNGSVAELWSANVGFRWPGKDPGNKGDIVFGTIGVSQGFGKTIGWQITDGQDFPEKSTGKINHIIVNESAVKYMGLKNPVGEYIQWNGKNLMISGVIKDMIMESPYKPVTPTVFFIGSWAHATVDIRLNPNLNVRDALSKIESVYKRYSEDTPFDYRFADDEYAKKFSAEVRIGKMVGFFVVLAILISCSGLFGLASFLVEKRS